MILCKVQYLIHKNIIKITDSGNLLTYGTLTGNMSAIILMESLFAFDVGEAASNIFNKAIICVGKLGNMAYKISIKLFTCL